MRVYFALVFEDEVREALVVAREGFEVDPLRVRWVPPERLHVTLHFLGSLPESRLDDVTEAARETTSEVERFELRLRGLGAFPPRTEVGGGARVLWAGVVSCAPLLRLASMLGASLDRRRIDRDRKRFRPHVTLGRPVGRSRRIALATAPDPERAIATQQVRSVQLLESRRTPTGFESVMVESFPLGSPRGSPGSPR